MATVGVGYGDGLNKARGVPRAGARGRQALPAAGVLHGPVLRGCHRRRRMPRSATSTFFGYDNDGNFLSSQETANLIGDDEGAAA